MCLDGISARKKRKHLQSHLRLARLRLAHVPASPPPLGPSLCSVIHVPLSTLPEPPIQLQHLLNVPTLQKPPGLCPQQDTPLEGVSHHPQLQLTSCLSIPWISEPAPSHRLSIRGCNSEDNLPKTCFWGFSPLFICFHKVAE